MKLFNTILLAVSVGAGAGILACDPGAGESADDAAGVGRGKTDNVNTAGQCTKSDCGLPEPSADGCFCDATCLDIGDCCQGDPKENNAGAAATVCKEALGETGCETPLCPFDKFCEFGEKKVDGCPTCECAPPPKCETPLCPFDSFCEFGVKVVDGCPTCECAPPPKCEAVLCPFGPFEAFCEFGAELKDGCPTCDCAPAPQCDPVVCTLACGPDGLDVDEEGCPTCACAPPSGCEPVVCQLACGPDGLKVDDKGCPTCACA